MADEKPEAQVEQGEGPNAGIDFNNPYWEALRKAAPHKNSLGVPMGDGGVIPPSNTLILELSPLTGQTTVVTNPYAAREITPARGAEMVLLCPPLMFRDTEQAREWISEQGVEGFKYLIVQSVEDAEGEVPRRQGVYARHCASRDALMVRMGFSLEQPTDARTFMDCVYRLVCDVETEPLSVQYVTGRSEDEVLARAQEIITAAHVALEKVAE